MGLVHFNVPAIAQTQWLRIKNIHSSRTKCRPVNMAFQKQLSMSTKAQHRPCLLLSADALFLDHPGNLFALCYAVLIPCCCKPWGGLPHSPDVSLTKHGPCENYKTNPYVPGDLFVYPPPFPLLGTLWRAGSPSCPIILSVIQSVLPVIGGCLCTRSWSLRNCSHSIFPLWTLTAFPPKGATEGKATSVWLIKQL